jgi:hypothetical protein
VIHVAQVEAVHGRRQLRRIRIPVQQIERKRRPAEQVVVDDARPDKIIGAQHFEGRRHIAAFKIALGVHPLFERAQLLFVDKDREFAGVRKIDHCYKIGRTLDPVIALSCHVGQSTGK